MEFDMISVLVGAFMAIYCVWSWKAVYRRIADGKSKN